MPAQRPIGYWLKVVDKLIDAQFSQSAADAGITRRQWQILNVLAERGEAKPEEVRAAIAPFLDAGETLDQHLIGIEDLVSVQPGGIRMTAAGIERLESVKARSVQRLRDRIASGLTPEDYDTTLRTLERMARNLGWSE
ncbi:MAG TPA: hypothetical protein VK028_00035 [Micromonosporaceae bacterium]|nr:hypothetical protein [Micromonosporaceae bacterium]